MRIGNTGLAAFAVVALSACGEPGDQAGPAGPASSDAVPAAFGQCKACHSTQPGANGVGPSLAGVFGQTAAHEPSFAYSPAMRQSGLTWDAETLDVYLRNPRETVPGTKMGYNGLRDDAARAELVEWLKGV